MADVLEGCNSIRRSRILGGGRIDNLVTGEVKQVRGSLAGGGR